MKILRIAAVAALTAFFRYYRGASLSALLVKSIWHHKSIVKL